MAVTTKRIMPPQLRSRHGDSIVTTLDIARDGSIHSENVTLSVQKVTLCDISEVQDVSRSQHPQRRA